MAWNGSNNVDSSIRQQNSNLRAETDNRRSKIKYVIAIVGAALCVGLCIILFINDNADRSAEKSANQNAPIREAIPAVISNQVAKIEEKPLHPNEETYVDAHGVKRYKIGNGAIYDPTKKTRKVNPFRDADGNKRFGSKYTIFESRTQNEIARLISMKPGSTMFGTRIYDKEFEAEYLESLKQPIKIEPSDTPYQVELKKNMIEVNKEIQARMAKGEKLSAILGEARDELHRLAAYKRDMQKQVSTLIESHPDYTENDINDLVSAANKMLRDNGVSEISSKRFLAAHLSMCAEEAKERNTEE